MVRRIATPVAGNAIALDLANLLTSKVTEAIANMVDPRRPDISITIDTPLTGADGGYVRFYNSLADKQLAWTFVVPPTTTTFKAPALPPAADPWVAIPDGGGPSSFVEVVFADSEAHPDYKAFRRQPATNTNFGNIPTLVNGTTRLTSWSNGT